MIDLQKFSLNIPDAKLSPSNGNDADLETHQQLYGFLEMRYGASYAQKIVDELRRYESARKTTKAG